MITVKTKFTDKSLRTEKKRILEAAADFYGLPALKKIEEIQAETEEAWNKLASKVNEYFRINDLEAEYPYDINGTPIKAS